MTDGILLAAGCAVSFIFLAGVYVFLRGELRWGGRVDTDEAGVSDTGSEASGSVA